MSAEMQERLSQLARDLQSQPDQENTLQGVVEAAVALIGPCETAGITLARRHARIEGSAATDDIPRRSDEMQSDLREGPCIDAIWEQRVVSVPDLLVESRWPAWAPAAVSELGVRSMLCLRLFTHGDRVGALNLFSSRPRAFTPDDVDLGIALAAHAAVAAMAARDHENMMAALDNRTAIGQVTGLIMGQYGLSSGAAIAVLKRLSSHENRKIAEIAVDLVREHDRDPQRSFRLP